MYAHIKALDSAKLRLNSTSNDSFAAPKVRGDFGRQYLYVCLCLRKPLL